VPGVKRIDRRRRKVALSLERRLRKMDEAPGSEERLLRKLVAICRDWQLSEIERVERGEKWSVLS
jgi:hypothetical protein